MNYGSRIREIPFFALPPDRITEGTIPVFEVRHKGKGRLQATPPDDMAQPLFYGLPDTALTEITPGGTWECDADGYPLILVLLIEGSVVKGTFDEASLIIKKGSLQRDTIELFVEDTNDLTTYVVKARLKDGKLNGEFQNMSDNSKGEITGKQTAPIYKEFRSKVVVPLFEYKNQEGYYSYSVESELEGLQRSEKPVCRVWKNPSTLLTLDFDAKYVPIIEQTKAK